MVLNLWGYQVEIEIPIKDDFQLTFPVAWFDTLNFYMPQPFLLIPTLKIIYTLKNALSPLCLMFLQYYVVIT